MTRIADGLIYAGAGLAVSAAWCADWRAGVGLLGVCLLVAGVLVAMGAKRDDRKHNQ